jgi:DNA polymerase III epsilon subunit-like protein
MKLLIFDTETTGLPKDRKKNATKESNNWPHIVSISWVILDDVTNVISTKKSFIIKPDGWSIPYESTKIHGITEENALRTGIPLNAVLKEFSNEIYDYLVSHNIEFDFNVLMNAYYWDLNQKLDISLYRRKCTMLLSTDLCKLPAPWGGYRWPKLSELYEFTFHRKPTGTLHNSLYDALILAEIIQSCNELRDKMGLPIKTRNTTNDFN